MPSFFMREWRARVEPELHRRIPLALDAPVTGFEHAEDMLPLNVLEPPGPAPDDGRRHRGLEALPDLVETKHGSGREDEGPLEDIAQLADIARPVVRDEPIHGRRRHALDLLADRPGQVAEKVPDEERDVFLARPEDEGLEQASESPKEGAPAKYSTTQPPWVDPVTFFDQLPAVMKQVPPMPGEEALYKWIASVLDAAAKDPEVMKTLRATAVAADKELIAPMMRWRYNGQPAGTRKKGLKCRRFRP